MKIHGSTLIPPEAGAAKKVAAPGAGPGRFGEIFRQALDERPRVDGCGREVRGAAEAGSLSLRADCARPEWIQVEGFLNILDDYRRKLADPGFSLRAIDPVVREMEAGRAGLTQVEAALPDGDGLKEICNRALVTAAVEIVKFRRGDYIAA
jgi:hypothetical protein